MTLLGRIPIRVRLVLGFAAVMALVLALTGAFIYDRTRDDLNRQIQRELDARLAAAVAIIRDDGDDLGDPEFDPLGRLDAGAVVQVLGPGPRIVDATSDELREHPLISFEQLQGLEDGSIDVVEVDSPIGPVRVIAGRTQDDGVRYVPIVAAPVSERDEALASLSRLLLIGGPLALLLSSLAAYGVATAALRPVEAMRRGAERISGHNPGARLPVGAADDEIADLGRTLNDLLARLDESIRRERRFVADASHELRTPLTILRSQVDLALESGTDPDELRAALRSCGEEVDRMTRLAADLLVLARADEGRLPVEPRAVPLRALAAEVAAAVGETDPRAAIGVEVPADLVIDADPDRIRQALTNLLQNAIRHGGGDVTVRAERLQGGTEIHVIDDGPGFPPELRGREAERFSRGRAARSRSGSGLGLAIVAAIAGAHGGELRIDAVPSGGADVAIVLPQRR